MEDKDLIKLLTEYRDQLLRITRSMPEYGIMDYIRLEQVEDIDKFLEVFDVSVR